MGRPPKNGKYTNVPRYLAHYAQRLGPELRSLDDEIAIITEMAANTLAEMAESGCPRWGDATEIWVKLSDSLACRDLDAAASYCEELGDILEQGGKRDDFEDRLTDQWSKKANLIEKSTKIEEKAGLMVSARDVFAHAAFVEGFLAAWATKLPGSTGLEMLRDFQRQSASKGYVPDPQFDRANPAPPGVPN